ncbi:MAG: succinylglutamate desuccinylase/aspartoacylase family protein [Gemmatimonadota bacterium]
MDPSQTYDLLRTLTTPVAAVTSARNGKRNGMITDGAVRASIVPDVPRLVVPIHKWHLTHEIVSETGRFAVHLLHRGQVEVVTRLGFASGRERDKLADLPHRIGVTGCPILEDCYAWFDCTVINWMDTGSSTLFLGQAMDAGRGRGEELLEPAHLREALPPEFRDRYPRNLAAAQEQARPLAWLFTPATTVLLLALATAVAPARAQEPAPLTVGAVTARAGQSVSGYIDVPAGVDSATRIPITVVRGARSGPTLALIAGTHGYETQPILALQRVRRSLDPAQLAGTVLLVHVANPPSYYGRTIYYSPVDGKNLNRVYPGRADGTVSERIAYAIAHQVIEKADYIVDLHAGDGNESLRPYAYWTPLGRDARVDSLQREMILAFGHDLIVVDTTRPRDFAASVYTTNTALLLGKPAITTENGYLGEPAEAMIQRNVDGVGRLLRWLGMVPGTMQLPQRVRYLHRFEVLRSPETGTWHPAVRREQVVREGDLLGYLTDIFGDGRTEIRAPFGGEVLYVVATPPMSRGEPLAMLGAVR